MDLVTGPMGVLPAKFLDLVKEEYKLQSGLQKQVESLSDELEVIRNSFLSVVAQVPPDKQDPQTKLWRRDVQEASYDMEDILDDFLVRVDGGPQQPAGPDGLMSKIKELFCFGNLKARHEIATEIVDIMERLEGIHKRHAKYRVDHLVAAAKPAAASSSVIDPRISARLKEASHLVGIEEPMKALIERLSLGKEHKSCKKMKILSIFGSGGLGKTTLAQAVYDKVNRNFDCSAFVSVGQNADPRKFLQDILVGLADSEREETVIRHDKETTIIDRDKKRYITRADLNGLTANDLVIEICKFLQGKRCFIVVDDIWDENIWFEAIENAFVNSITGSRIIATTRRSDVAKNIGEPFEIQLSGDSPKKLLSKILFDSEDKIDNDEMAEKFLDKCHGLPLAITAIGRLLAPKPKNEWANVYDSIFLNSFGSESEKDPQIKNAMLILSFSYYDLPCHLRTCMLYLSVFPEEHYVDKNMLIWRWIAEGFVLPEQRKGPFEVGEGYFDELVNRGLILPSADSVNVYRVHDFVLDLIRELSREQNFVITVAGSEQEQSLSLPGGGKVRRLALQKISDRIINGCLPVEVDDERKAVARSFNAIYSTMLDHISVAGFKRLRVLALEYCLVEGGYLEDIKKLLYLRYLGLTGTEVGKLPEGVGNLKFLQTLILNGTGIKELPKSLEHRTELMCLRADQTTAVPDWIGKLTSLVELEMYPDASSAGSFVKEVGQLRRLRVLKTQIHLQDEGQARDLLESLSKLGGIEIVDVEFSSETIKLTEEGVTQQSAPVLDFKNNNNLRVLILDALPFPRLPAWINPRAVPKLYKLKLDLSEFEQQHMDILGGFPILRCLELLVAGEFSPNYDIIICGEGGFQNLVTFELITYSSMMIKFEPGAMPRLRDLMFQIGQAFDKHEKLELHYGLENLRSLERVEATILCLDCFPPEIEAVEAAVRRQVLGIRANNPPTLSMTRWEEGIIDPERMLTRRNLGQTILRERCQRVYQRLVEQSMPPFKELIEESYKMLQDWTQSGSCYGSLVNKARRMSEECMNTLENAFNVRILQHDGLFDDDDPLIIIEQFVEQLNAKLGDYFRFAQREQDVHEMMDYVASLERGIEVLTVTASDYQRLAAMWEEVQAQHSLLVQNKLHNRLYIDFATTNLLPVDGMKPQVLRFMDQWYDTVELAFHGRIFRRSELGAEDHRDYHQEMVGFWEKYNAKYKELIQFEEDRDIDRLREHIAALKGAIDVLTAAYPRLVPMWKELQAAEDGLLPAIVREKELWERLLQLMRRYSPLVSPGDLLVDKLLAVDAKKVVHRYLYQSWDMLELALHGRILWRSELGDEDHPDYCSQGWNRVYDQLEASLQLFGRDRDDVHQVNIAVKEAMLEKLTVEYPRVAAMLERLKAELCLPAVEHEGTDTIPSNVTEEPEEQQHCLSDQ